jgi:hypothetical protein
MNCFGFVASAFEGFAFAVFPGFASKPFLGLGAFETTDDGT